MSSSDTTDPGKPLPTGQRAALKRQAIVTAARELFLREGFGVGMDAIAARAGASKVTVYNHFGSKEALFTAVVAGVLDEPLRCSSAPAIQSVAEAENLREALIEAARAWVEAVRANADVLALRNLVTAELHRFPQLGAAWRDRGPEAHHPEVARTLRTLTDQGRLEITDVETAVIQLYALLIFPHLVFSAYGTELADDLTGRLITEGVDMFLGHYGPGSRHADRPA